MHSILPITCLARLSSLVFSPLVETGRTSAKLGHGLIRRPNLQHVEVSTHVGTLGTLRARVLVDVLPGVLSTENTVHLLLFQDLSVIHDGAVLQVVLVGTCPALEPHAVSAGRQLS